MEKRKKRPTMKSHRFVEFQLASTWWLRSASTQFKGALVAFVLGYKSQDTYDIVKSEH